MQGDLDPFPFCNLCATWHAPDEHLNEQWNAYYHKRGRLDFWYGWFCGAACTSAFLLVVRLIWISG